MKMRIILVLIMFELLLQNCKKETNDGLFRLTSPEIATDSILPADYTCEGTQATLPLNWENPPASAKSFVLIMHHIASPEDIHWYWILYNIPSSVRSLSKNTTGIGILGTNSVNDKTEYAGPCSQGPGEKYYTYTLYALSQELSLNVAATEVDREFMLNTIKDITIDSACIVVKYSRNIK